MTEFEKRDYEIADRVARLGNAKTVLPKHVRIMGGFFLAASAVFVAINVHALSNGQIAPKALILASMTLLLGLWWLFDAKAIADGKRKHQKAILWACIGTGFVTGLAIVRALTGSFL